MKGRTLVAAMCAGQVCSLLPHVAFPALIPLFKPLWGLSATEAGFIAGSYSLGYMGAVPFLAALTDRIDARGILALGAASTALATLAFGLFAEGLWSAAALWGLAGIAFAGAYMPGLKAIADRIDPGDQSRSLTSYTASFSLGVGLSFLLSQTIASAWGWRAAFLILGAAPFAMVAVALALPPKTPAAGTGRLFDFAPVFRNRRALGFILGYGAHCFELAAMRAWLVAFWTWLVARDPGDPLAIGAAALGFAVTVLGMPSSIGGNELCLRFGRHRTISALQGVSAATALAIGAGVALGAPVWAMLALVLLYACTVTSDSGSLTSGMVGAADSQAKGATMAIHSTVGFGASFLGPFIIGLVLDASGGADRAEAWTAAHGAMAAGILLGPLALYWARRGGGFGRE